nr:MAG TPA: hypothetical protein [Bacteriophage sp.]
MRLTLKIIDYNYCLSHMLFYYSIFMFLIDLALYLMLSTTIIH